MGRLGAEATGTQDLVCAVARHCNLLGNVGGVCRGGRRIGADDRGDRALANALLTE